MPTNSWCKSTEHCTAGFSTSAHPGAAASKHVRVGWEEHGLCLVTLQSGAGEGCIGGGTVNLPSMETELLDKSGGRRERKQNKKPQNNAGQATRHQAPVRDGTAKCWMLHYWASDANGVIPLGFRMMTSEL